MSVLRRLSTIISIVVTLIASVGVATPTEATSKRLPDELRVLIAQGQPHDEVPLIITLTNSLGLERAQATRSERLQRRAAVRRLQSAFVQRQVRRIRQLKGQTNVTPMLFVTARRADIEALYNDVDVVRIAPDTVTPVAMYDSNQLLGLQVSHDAGYDGTGTSVAVLDTGVLSTHEFLSGQVVAEACFSTSNFYSTSYCPGSASSSTATGSGAPCPTTTNGCYHGTHVAGTIAGKAMTSATGFAMRGVAPGAKIIAIQVFSYFRSGTDVCTQAAGCLASWDSDQIRALDWLYDNATTPAWGTLASVNMSLGGTTKYATACDGDARKTYVDQLRTIGVATVIASGNSGYSDGVGSPACISTAIAVGATRLPKYGLTADVVASFSNAPSNANNNQLNANGDRLLDLLGPGQYVYSSMISSTTTYAILSGTSMATPHVAGAWAVLKQINSTASVPQVLSWLYDSGVMITDSRNAVQLPRISLFAAVNAALGYPAIEVTATSTPTASRTPTYTPTTLATASDTATVTSTATNTATNTATLTVTDTATNTATHTVTSTATNTATHTVTSTATNTATNTPTSTVTRSRTLTQTPTRTATRTSTPVPRPGRFQKSAPIDFARNRPLTLTLWWTASAGATTYEYCLSTTLTCTNWRSIGDARMVVMRNLTRNTVYVWNVRARNARGITVSDGTPWRFITTR